MARSGARAFPAFLLVGYILMASAASGEPVIRDLKNTKIINSREQPHNILNEACLACHPREKFDFWLLIYKGKPPTLTVDHPEEKGEGGGAGPGAASVKPKNRFNSHDALSCNFCHFENPKAGQATFIVEIEELCRLCHPGTSLHNLPKGEPLARVRKAIRENKLPGKDGDILCTTCHRLHDSTYGMRDAYTRILWEGSVPNPHGKRDLCFACHPGFMKEGTPVKLASDGDPIRLCNECHLRPGIRKAPHVVDVGTSEGTWRMDYLGYPLKDGKLVCTSCHDEVSHGKPDPANPKFLRGGPYTGTDMFCYRCHMEDKQDLNNPHRQLDPFGRIREDSCRFCHRKMPDPAKPKPEDSQLTGDESSICQSCHTYKPHPDVDHHVRLSPEKEARRSAYEARHQVKIPLANDGTIKCSTCHNPHGKGVLKDASGVGAGSKWRVPDFREVCAPCHGRY